MFIIDFLLNIALSNWNWLSSNLKAYCEKRNNQNCFTTYLVNRNWTVFIRTSGGLTFSGTFIFFPAADLENAFIIRFLSALGLGEFSVPGNTSKRCRRFSRSRLGNSKIWNKKITIVFGNLTCRFHFWSTFACTFL